MKEFVINDPKIANCIYSIFDKHELSKYITKFRKRFPLANDIEICPNNSSYYLEPKVNIFSIDTKIFIPVGCMDFKEVYSENEWNPYPALLPPNPHDYVGWLVQNKDGCIVVAYFSDEEGGFWFNQTMRLDNVVAFRKLPEKYTNEL